MDTLTLLTTLADAHASLSQSADAGMPTVRVHMASAAWTPALREHLSVHKAVLLRLLAMVPLRQLVPAEALLGWQETYEARAAILEYDAGMPRLCAEIDAWEALRKTLTPEKE
mgnify:CR=1 FL=1